ncbi:hypothetical protein F66182_859 [Fusarium sp. NRRL 66182]|nr:hypothetical protein F66182_859 [Fusarium sp. NRRL 66182]
MASPILLILGAGPNIGTHVAKGFAAKGYRVALASRKAHALDDVIHIPVDLSMPESVPNVFETVKSTLGAPPSVVVYNAAAIYPYHQSDPLSSLDAATYTEWMSVNTLSALSALRQSVIGFKTLPPSCSKTFIYTGNMLNIKHIPGMMSLGLGKVSTAFIIQYLSEIEEYKDDGISFYYADERTSDGEPVFNDISGSAAADEYWKLAERKQQGPWMHTFVSGHGYKDFGDGW